MVDFAGWDMPVQYQGILAEHKAVRTRAGLFDVSHMGRIHAQGPDAASFLDHLITNDIAGLAVNRARYGFLCNERGGILDDLVTIRRTENEFLVVCNAASWDRVLPWLRDQAAVHAVQITPQRDDTAMLALQGPQAQDILNSLCGADIVGLRRFACEETSVSGIQALVSRTGYTGENGYEIVTDADAISALWDTLLQDPRVMPCGLGARDTLRLEAGLPLYGNDMDETTTPLEAGLERFVDLNKDFIGAAALRKQAAEGPSRRLTGFRMNGRAAPRHGYNVHTQAGDVSTVTSGGYSPSLGVGIGLAYLPTDQASPGTHLNVDIRGKIAQGTVVPLPFYRRSK